jgi:hypothetical protein
MARLAGLRHRFRCFWSPPLGHPYELLEYVDSLSGKWAARSRCVRCGHESGLAVGEAKHGDVFPGNPLATAMARQGVKRSGPPAATPGLAPDRPSALTVRTPEGREIAVDHVRVQFLFGRGRTLYWAKPLDGAAPAILDPDLARALARAAGSDAEASWSQQTARSLADELPVRE